MIVLVDVVRTMCGWLKFCQRWLYSLFEPCVDDGSSVRVDCTCCSMFVVVSEFNCNPCSSLRKEKVRLGRLNLRQRLSHSLVDREKWKKWKEISIEQEEKEKRKNRSGKVTKKKREQSLTVLRSGKKMLLGHRHESQRLRANAYYTLTFAILPQ